MLIASPAIVTAAATQSEILAFIFMIITCIIGVSFNDWCYSADCVGSIELGLFKFVKPRDVNSKVNLCLTVETRSSDQTRDGSCGYGKLEKSQRGFSPLLRENYSERI